MPTRGSGAIGYAELQQYMGGSNPIYNSEYRGVDGSWVCGAIFNSDSYSCRPRPYYLNNNSTGGDPGCTTIFSNPRRIRINSNVYNKGGATFYCACVNYYPGQFDGIWANNNYSAVSFTGNRNRPSAYQRNGWPYFIWQCHNQVSGYRYILPYYYLYSDYRLKTNIRYIGLLNGHRYYTWIWNDKAKALGLIGKGIGVIAQEIQQYMPSAVKKIGEYYQVNYDALKG